MFQEFPKWIPIPESEEGGIVVFSKEEEIRMQSEPNVQPEPQLPLEPKKRGRPRKVANGVQ